MLDYLGTFLEYMRLWTADKKPYASAVVPAAPVQFPSQKPLAPSIISASDK